MESRVEPKLRQKHDLNRARVTCLHSYLLNKADEIFVGITPEVPRVPKTPDLVLDMMRHMQFRPRCKDLCGMKAGIQSPPKEEPEAVAGGEQRKSFRPLLVEKTRLLLRRLLRSRPLEERQRLLRRRLLRSL